MKLFFRGKPLKDEDTISQHSIKKIFFFINKKYLGSSNLINK